MIITERFIVSDLCLQRTLKFFFYGEDAPTFVTDMLQGMPECK